MLEWNGKTLPPRGPNYSWVMPACGGFLWKNMNIIEVLNGLVILVCSMKSSSSVAFYNMYIFLVIARQTGKRPDKTGNMVKSD